MLEPTETHDESSNKLKHVARLGLSTMDGSSQNGPQRRPPGLWRLQTGGLNEHCAVVNEPETGLLPSKFHKVLGTAGSVLIAKQES